MAKLKPVLIGYTARLAIGEAVDTSAYGCLIDLAELINALEEENVHDILNRMWFHLLIDIAETLIGYDHDQAADALRLARLDAIENAETIGPFPTLYVETYLGLRFEETIKALYHAKDHHNA